MSEARVLQSIEAGVGVVLFVGAEIVSGAAGFVPGPLFQNRFRERLVDIERDAGVVAQAGALGELGDGRERRMTMTIVVVAAEVAGALAVAIEAFDFLRLLLVVERRERCRGGGSAKGPRGRFPS